MTPEKLVKQKVVAILKEFGAYYQYQVTSGYGASGGLDLTVCYRGRFIAIECKAGKNKPTPLQESTIARVNTAGGITLVINEGNIDDVRAILSMVP